MNKFIIIGIIVANLAALAAYLLVPEDKEAQLFEEAMKVRTRVDRFIEAYCSDSNEMPREYLINLIRKEYPDQKIEDLCPKTVPQK